jgi:hypothetical protein
MKTLKLSELLKIGVKYIQLDSTSSVIFNDGTKMLSRWSEWNNGEGSSGEDHDFVCMRDGECYNVEDDVYKTLPLDERMGIGSVPKWTKDRKPHPHSVWQTDL